MEADNPQALFDIIVLSDSKLNRLPYKTPEEIFNYIKSVYYYGLTEGYSHIQDAIWEFTNGLYSNDGIYNHIQKSEERRILYLKAINKPLGTEQLSHVHIRTFKYIRGRATPTQNVFNIVIDQSEVPKEKDVVISKVNLGGEEIAGAKIQINQGNKEVANWISEAGKNHELSLLPGEYVFREEVAPKGYVIVAANNQLIVTDEMEYVNPTGT